MLNVISFLFDRNHDNLDQLALSDPDHSITYRDLISATAKLSTWLSSKGVGSQDRVAIVGLDTVYTAIVSLAVIYTGGISSIINPRFSKERINQSLNDIDPLIVLDDRAIEHAITESQALVESKPCPTSPTDCCALIWTSGTTGKPKASMHTHFSFLYNAMVCSDNYQVGRGDRVYYTAKLFSGYGTSLFLTSLWGGAENYIDHDLVVHFRIKKNIDRFLPTKFFSTPSIYSHLCLKSDISSMSKIDRCVISGERLNQVLLDRWESATGKKLFNHYGTTELLSGPIHNHDGTSTLGKVIPGWKVRIVDENNHEVDDGSIGLLQVQAHACAVGYWKDPEQSKKIFGTWVNTNDLCLKDHNGIYHFYGRKDDLVKVSGEFVNLSNLDKTLMDHKEVAHACCVIKANDQGIDHIEAFVVPLNNSVNHVHLESELKQYVLSLHKRVECPSVVHVIQDLPRTEAGKISRYAYSETTNKQV